VEEKTIAEVVLPEPLPEPEPELAPLPELVIEKDPEPTPAPARITKSRDTRRGRPIGNSNRGLRIR